MLWKRRDALETIQSTKINHIQINSIKINLNETSIKGLLWAFGSPGTLLGILRGILWVYFGVYFWDRARAGLG